MIKFSDKKCVPCEGGMPPLTAEEITRYKPQITNWEVSEDKKSISREIKFKDFKEALNFVNKVGRIAEDEGHHPDIKIFNWNKVKITLSTHSIGGLSENDFILAAKIDELK